MNKSIKLATMIMCSATIGAGCTSGDKSSANYGEDKSFLKEYLELVELTDGDKRVLLTPDYQGRVMTSSAEGEDGKSFGWINRKLISSGEVLPHCNNWGGEDRMWIGPEGGQFAYYFPSTESFDFEKWQVPSIIDTDKWITLSHGEKQATFGTTTSLTNASGAIFNFKLERTVSLLNDKQVEDMIGADIPAGCSSVGFRSENRVFNIGMRAWNKETGAPSIWILGQFISSPENHVVIPTRGDGRIVDNYFGEIPAERLSKKGDCYYFKADGKLRGKIGTPPESTLPMAFSLDREGGLLTIVSFSFDETATDYVNSQWAMQEEPFKGDVINAYNDGPLEDGTIMGGFYEIETSSKALFLKSGESHEHTHNTIHIKGDVAVLEALMNELVSKLK